MVKDSMTEIEETTYIHYHFNFQNGTEMHFPIELRLSDMKYIQKTEKVKPAWTKLEHEQCENCQLKSRDHPHCPIAINLSDIIPNFNGFKSFEKALIRVETPERIYEKEAPLQVGLGSLLGIIMVTSGCPIMRILRPMVRFHLPFATIEETVYRSASCHLLGQYFKVKKGEKPDWDLQKLAEAYDEIQKVNVGITDRLRTVSEEDANANAIVVLDVFAKALPSSIFVNLEDLEYLFEEVTSSDE